MNHIAVIYWSGTGNTQIMAEAVSEGAKSSGAEVAMFNVSEINASAAGSFDRLALGCPAMGGEVLEETEFEPFFNDLEQKLAGKKVALFGSYGWGDGQWMRDWQQRVSLAGAEIVSGNGLILHETPDAAGLELCRNIGRGLAD